MSIKIQKQLDGRRDSMKRSVVIAGRSFDACEALQPIEIIIIYSSSPENPVAHRRPSYGASATCCRDDTQGELRRNSALIPRSLLRGASLEKRSFHSYGIVEVLGR